MHFQWYINFTTKKINKINLTSIAALTACLNGIRGLLSFFMFTFGYAAFLNSEFSMAVGKT